MMGIVVKKDDEVGRVGIAHWWPSRAYWFGDSPLPAYVRKRAYRMKSKYMSMVQVELPGGILTTYAVCRENDQPSRAKGRFIALLRMGRLLKSMGLKMERL